MSFRIFASRYPGFINEVQEAKQRSESLQDQLVEATQRGQRDRKRLLMRRLLLGDNQTRLYFSFEGVRRARRLASFDPTGIREIAANLNVYAPFHEPVETRVIRRGTKDRRIFSFRPQSRARQLLVAAVLKAIHGPFPDQFTLRGGVPGALGAAERAVHDGYRYCRELDIRDFYPSVTLEHLLTALQPLPRAVVENVVWMGQAVPLVSLDSSLHGVHDDGLVHAGGLRGLPQGSACSPVAAEKLVFDVINALPQGTRVVGYADNIMLFSENEDQVLQATSSLVGELTTRSAGSLALKAPYGDIYDARVEAFPFLGREGSAIRNTDPLEIDWQPDHFVFEGIYDLMEEGSAPATKEALRETIKRVQRWAGTYPMWRTCEGVRLRFLAELKVRLALKSGSIERSVLAGQIAAHLVGLGYPAERSDLGFAAGLDDLFPMSGAESPERRAELIERITARRDLLMARASNPPPFS